MPQLFSPHSDTLLRIVLGAGSLLFGSGVWGAYTLYFSPFNTDVGHPVAQPVPFSHQHHVAGLGIDCRYCHTSVEQGSSAGMPATETCMTCHSQVWRDAPVLQPVRESWLLNKPIRWNRVNDLPDHVYFNHSIHVTKGIGCVSCHGETDRMPLTWKAHSLFMRWCLDCHRHPENHLRPVAEVFNQRPGPLPGQPSGADLVRRLNIVPARLDDCSICHR